MIRQVAVLMAALAAAEQSAPPPTGVTRHALEGAVRIDAVLPGRLISYALPAIGSGRREILMLVEPEGPPSPPQPTKPNRCQEQAGIAPMPKSLRWLYRLDLAGDESGGALTRLRDDLPSDAVALDAIDLDADSRDEILLTRPGGLHILRDIDGRRAAGGPDLLMTDPAILEKGSAHLEPRWMRRPGVGATTTIPIPFLGGVRFYGPTAEGRSWDQLLEAPLTLEAERSSGGLKLSSPKVQMVGRRHDGAILFASGPQTDGGRRLRTMFFEPAAQGGSRETEVWSDLPGFEAVIESRYLTLDGRPALVVTTRPSDKLSLFGEKMLRVFLLDETDRSRNGVAPIFAVDSHMNLWQAMTPVARDVDGDGREDLVLGYWKGLKDSRVMLDVHLRREDGSFSRSPVTTDFDVEHGDRSLVEYGRDLDGDGGADLLLLSRAGVLIYPGKAVLRGGHDLVEKTARFTIPVSSHRDESDENDGSDLDINISIGGGGKGGGGLAVSSDAGDSGSSSGRGLPRAVDLDGDGVSEIVVAQPGEQGRGRFQVIRLVLR